MNKLIVASTRANAGKTSVIVGLTKNLEGPIGYMKPFGDRLLYRKKRLWDHDAALITRLFGLTHPPEEMSLGFDHSKLRYMYDELGLQEKLRQAVEDIGSDKAVLFFEGGKDLTYGASVHLDAIALAKYLDGTLLLVVSGDSDTILDDIAFVQTYVRLADVRFGGVLINKVQDVDDFNIVYRDAIVERGIRVLGVLPYRRELTYFTIDYLAERLFAKVIAGEEELHRTAKHILVGAMSADAVLRHPGFQAKSKLVITSGDRSDMILAALDNDTAGIILTNNILPPPNIIARASERNVPLLLVQTDTYQTAKRIDDLEPLLMPTSAEKVDLLAQLVQQHVDLEAVVGR